MAAKDSPLSKTCDGILAKAVFDWKEMIRPDGMLCNKDLEICDSSGRIYPLSIEMKELYLQTQPKNRKITFKFTLHAPTRFVKFEINLDKLFGDKPVVVFLMRRGLMVTFHTKRNNRFLLLARGKRLVTMTRI